MQFKNIYFLNEYNLIILCWYLCVTEGHDKWKMKNGKFIKVKRMKICMTIIWIYNILSKIYLHLKILKNNVVKIQLIYREKYCY